MDILAIKGDYVKKGKIKYIFKKMFTIFLIAIISIVLYQLFIELKNTPTNQQTYGTKLSADEENKEEQEDISSIIEKVSSAVVGISKIKNTGSSVFLSNSSESLGLGSGIIVSNKGYILTNQHVAGDENNICYVTLENGETYKGKIIWSNTDIDLAIIKIDKIFNNTIKIGNSNSIRVGENVYAIGNPIGYEFQRTVTGGIISAINRTVKIKNTDETYSYMSNLIQTDATINPGNSGGPLIDKKGNIIGINTIKITSAEGIGFAIPINIVKPIIEKYEKFGEFKEAYLGVFAYDGSVMAYVDKDINLTKGVYIEKIAEDGPAKNTELKKGDVITKIDNTSVNKMSELQEYLFSKNPGNEIVLTIIRKDSERVIKVVLGQK